MEVSAWTTVSEDGQTCDKSILCRTSTGLQRVLTLDWTYNWEPVPLVPLVQHHSLTSQMLFWLNGHSWHTPESLSRMPVVVQQAHVGVMVKCALTFGHLDTVISRYPVPVVCLIFKLSKSEIVFTGVQGIYAEFTPVAALLQSAFSAFIHTHTNTGSSELPQKVLAWPSGAKQFVAQRPNHQPWVFEWVRLCVVLYFLQWAVVQLHMFSMSVQSPYRYMCLRLVEGLLAHEKFFLMFFLSDLIRSFYILNEAFFNFCFCLFQM